MKWITDRDCCSHGGYADWEELTRPGPADGASDFRPVFVRLRRQGERYAPVIAALIEDETTPTLIETHELAWLKTVIAREEAGEPLPGELRTVLYRPSDRIEDRTLYDVRHVSPAVPLRLPRDFRDSKPNVGRGEARKVPPAGAEPGPPVVAVIDDGIPYLNARFRRTPGRTRFEAVWLQAREDVAERPDAAGREQTELFVGRVLGAAAIDAMIAEGDEAATYARQNAALFPPGTRRSTDFAATHGGHVLDLAAGDEIGGALADVPLLAVQLPPHGIRDTSGRFLDGYVVQGLRWVIDQALALAERRRSPVPLIVNLSIGTIAGPKDGSGFVEDWLRAEVARYGLVSGGAPIRIVLAYGNARRARQVALAEVEAHGQTVVEWRLPPDDWTSSYLELRRQDAATLALQPPGCPQSRPRWPNPGDRMLLRRDDGAELAAIYGQRDGSAMIAVRRTDGPDGGPLAPAGAWRVILSAGPQPARLGLQVQRDETPGGYRHAGRQSTLAAPGSDGWDPETADYTLSADGPLQRAGTHTSYAGKEAVGICVVGAVIGGGADSPAARYSAAGADERLLTLSLGPALSAPGDRGRATSGLIAAATISGSVTRYSGTSMAAPQVCRHLMGMAMEGRLAALGDADLPAWRAELAGMVQGEARPRPDPRLGFGVLRPDPPGPAAPAGRVVA